jgi:hypothetical protein
VAFVAGGPVRFCLDVFVAQDFQAGKVTGQLARLEHESVFSLQAFVSGETLDHEDAAGLQ